MRNEPSHPNTFFVIGCTLLSICSLLACETGEAVTGGEKTIESQSTESLQAIQLAKIKRAATFERLVTHAKQALLDDQLHAAKQSLQKALILKPDNPEALALLTQVNARENAPGAVGRNGIEKTRAMLLIRLQEAIRRVNQAHQDGRSAITEGRYADAERALENELFIIDKERLATTPQERVGFDVNQRVAQTQEMLTETRQQRIASEETNARNQVKLANKILTDDAAEEDKRRTQEVDAIQKQAMMLAEKGDRRATLEELAKLKQIDPNNKNYSHFSNDVHSLLTKKLRKNTALSNKRQVDLRMVFIEEAMIAYHDVITFPSHEEWKKKLLRSKVDTFDETVQAEDPDNARIRNILQKVLIRNFDVADIREVTGQYPTLNDMIEHLKGQEVLESYEDELFIEFDRDIRESTDLLDSTYQEFRLLGEFSIDQVLRHILDQVELTYTIRNGTVTISDTDTVSEAFVVKVYDVADLVVPLTDFPAPSLLLTNSSDIGDSRQLGSETGGSTSSEELPSEGERLNEAFSMSIRALIKNIRNSIAQGQWTDPDDPEDRKGTIRPQNKTAMVVKQTPEVHRQIEDYLGKLRKLSGVLINIELRVITLDDNFLREVGVDLRDLTTAFSQVLSSVPSALIGSFPGGTSLPIVSVPSAGIRFKQIDNLINAASVNDVSLSQISKITNSGGLAIQGMLLSQLAVQGILTAVEKTNRAQLLTAPTITVFNTQQGSLKVTVQRSFISDDTPQGSGDTVVLNPEIGTLSTGTVLDVRPIASADRRFITITLRPQITTELDSDKAQISRGSSGGNAPVESQIELPKTIEQTVRTTVRVPDGGTVLIGGLRDVKKQEGRQATPILEKLPLLGFLFRREAEAIQKREIIILLTCRIIVMDEEEEKVR